MHPIISAILFDIDAAAAIAAGRPSETDERSYREVVESICSTIEKATGVSLDGCDLDAPDQPAAEIVAELHCGRELVAKGELVGGGKLIVATLAPTELDAEIQRSDVAPANEAPVAQDDADVEVEIEIPDVEELPTLKVDELRTLAEALEIELPAKGSKQELIDAIRAGIEPVAND